MPAAQNPATIPPLGPFSDAASLLPLVFSIAPNRIVSAAIQLGVFPEIAAGLSTPIALAEKIGANRRALRMLLEALAGMGLLIKTGENYRLTDVSRRHLLADAPDYVGAVLETDDIWESWTDLAAVVRSGEPHSTLQDVDVPQQFFPRLVRSLHVANWPVARRVAQRLLAGAEEDGLEIVDIGCGSGLWSIAIAELDAAARLTLLDLPLVLEHVAKEMVSRHGLSARTRLLAGSYHEIDLGSANYDLAILGNIIHMEGDDATRRLFQQSSRALRPRGRLAIIDMFPDDARSGPFFPLMFALHMLVRTREGDTYSVAQLRPWLAEAGFSRIETFDIGYHSPVLLAHK